MVKKCFSMVVVMLSLVLAGGTAVFAQDSCVTEQMATLAQPSTVAELRQYIDDLDGVLDTCDPLPDDVIEVEPVPVEIFNEEEILTDEHGCRSVIAMMGRWPIAAVSAAAHGSIRDSILFKMKKPGESRFREGEVASEMSYEDKDIHIWDDEVFPKGRYVLRYEPFIGANPVTLAFDVEHNTVYSLEIFCD